MTIEEAKIYLQISRETSKMHFICLIKGNDNRIQRENKALKNNVVNEQETIQNNIECQYRRLTP